MIPNGTRILVIDDMSMMRSLLKGQLRQMGLTDIFDAENGQKGFDILTQQLAAKKPIDMVLSDWNMPVMTGIELLKRVRAMPEFENLPFVLITAEGEADQVKEAIDSKVSNYIKKPITPALVQEKIAAVWKKYHPEG